MRTCLLALVFLGCGGNPAGYWDMPGCPEVPSGSYRVSETVCQREMASEVVIGPDGAWVSGCTMVSDRREPGTCSADVVMQCGAVTYAGRLSVRGPGVLVFVGDWLGGQTCDVLVTLTRL